MTLTWTLDINLKNHNLVHAIYLSQAIMLCALLEIQTICRLYHKLKKYRTKNNYDLLSYNSKKNPTVCI